MPPASKHVATPRMLATPKKTLSTPQLSKLSGLNTTHAAGIGPSLPKESTVSCKAHQAQEAPAIRTVRAESIASKKMSVPTTNKSIFRKRPALRSNIQEKPAPVKPFLPKECAASRQAREAREAAARQNAFNIKRIVGSMADKPLLSKKTAMPSRTQERASPGRTSSPKERGVSSLQAHIPVSVGKNRTDITSAATKPLLPKECAASRIARENRETIAAKQAASGHKNRTNHAPLPSSNSVLNARQRRPVSSISSTNTFLKDYPTVLEQREARDALVTRTTISAREGSVVWSTSPRYVVSHQKNDNRDRFSMMSSSSYATAATAKVPEKSGSSAKPLVPKECPESRRARLASEALAARKTLVGQRGSPIPNGLPGKYLSSAKTLSTSETHSACARTSLPPSKVHSATNSTQCIISTPDPYKERARKAASLSFRDQLDLNSASSTRSKPASRPKSMVSRLPIRVK